MTYPVVSFIVPVYNEERRIKSCLSSLFRQNYPINKIEVIVIDDKSTDNTVEIAKQFPIRLLVSGKRHAEISKMIGFKKAKGEFAMFIDADIELIGRDWIVRMTKPLLEDTELFGTFTRTYAKKKDPALERYLAFDPFHRDSLYQFFSPTIESTVKAKRRGYYLCEYKEGKVPPSGLTLFRRRELMRIVSSFDMFLELDFLVLLIRNGFNKFAYVPRAGYYHHHASSVNQLMAKRKRNVQRVYLRHVDNNLYIWFDLSKLNDLIKIILWTIYANLVIPSLFTGVIKSLKYKDWAGMYEPIVNLLVTDTIILSFLSDKKGRTFIKKRIWKYYTKFSS